MDFVGLAECKLNAKKPVQESSVVIFDESGIDNGKLGELGKNALKDIHILHRMMEAQGLAVGAVKAIEEGSKAIIDAALDAAVDETNGKALDGAAEGALEKIDRLRDSLAENEDLPHYRGAMVIVYTRCCKCVCNKPWYGFGLIERNEWECDKAQKDVFVLRNTGELFSLADFNGGMGSGDSNDTAEGMLLFWRIFSYA